MSITSVTALSALSESVSPVTNWQESTLTLSLRHWCDITSTKLSTSASRSVTAELTTELHRSLEWCSDRSTPATDSAITAGDGAACGSPGSSESSIPRTCTSAIFTCSSQQQRNHTHPVLCCPPVSHLLQCGSTGSSESSIPRTCTSAIFTCSSQQQQQRNQRGLVEINGSLPSGL